MSVCCGSQKRPLWSGLNFGGMASTCSKEEIDDVLDQVPTGMEPLYDCVLAAMEKNTQRLKLIEAILEWTMCGTRSLRINGLQAALSPIISSAYDGREGNKRALWPAAMIHATVRDYLLGPNSDSNFTMNKGDTSQHLTTMCLRYLLDDEMKPPRHPAMVSRPVSRSAFVDYACISFSEHPVISSSVSDDILLLLEQFFRKNILSWIEYICRVNKNLYYLSRTSTNLERYLERGTKHVPPLGTHYSNMQKWQVDLLPIVLKFGPNLIENHSSIYFFVQPICPTDSCIHPQFGRPPNNLQLSGLLSTAWDDCICYIDHKQSRAIALTGCDHKFAIGMKSGCIKLYQQMDYQENASLNHEAIQTPLSG
ncbi:hypothetical protein HJFPF1_08366 [Paramyrothecium foliicola]|nr:hypothetical protein HJFPF1_08366 [Paramyrothecium foliicola]